MTYTSSALHLPWKGSSSPLQPLQPRPPYCRVAPPKGAGGLGPEGRHVIPKFKLLSRGPGGLLKQRAHHYQHNRVTHASSPEWASQTDSGISARHASLGTPWECCLLTPFFDQRITGLLLVLQAVAIVLMGLALRRRNLGRGTAENRLRFERLMGELASELTTVSSDRVDEALGRWVGRLGSHFEADRVAPSQYPDHMARM